MQGFVLTCHSNCSVCSSSVFIRTAKLHFLFFYFISYFIFNFIFCISILDNEELQDLLNTSGDRKLKLCEDIKKGVVCQNLEEITVLNAGDIFDILQKGILII